MNLFSKCKKLSETVVRKFVEILDCSGWQIKSDEGWTDIKTINKTIEYQRYILYFQSGNKLECADNHIIITKDYTEIFAKDSLGAEILTEYGTDIVTEVIPTEIWENMYDFELADNSNHLYYSNGILSHNTTLMTIYALWLANFHPDQLIIILAHKEKMAKEIFSRIKLAYSELPNWVKEPVDNEWNDLSAKFANGSRILTSPTSANAIRGQSASCIILDEFAFVEDSIAQDFWTAVTPTLIMAPDAKMFVSSTPNGTDNIFYDLYNRSEQGKNNFKTEKVIWSDIPGRGAAWKKNVIESELNGDIDRFEQEYECRFLGSSNSAFPIRVFEQLKLDIKEPIQTLYEGNLNIWELPQTNRVYTMGVDVAEGLGKDASVIQIFDITDLTKIEQVAMYYSNLIDPTDFTTIVADIAKMYGNPVLSVERNNTGVDVCNRLYYDHNYPHFVNYGTAKSSSKNFRPGIISTNNVKAPAVVNMKTWLCNNWSVKIYDRRFSEELSHFIKKTNNVWQAERGHHDDIIMATVWALNVLHRNLVEDCFIVEDYNVQRMPLKVYNKFQYEIDKNFKSENIHKDIEHYPHMPAIIYGRTRFSLPKGGPFDEDLLEATKEDLELMGWKEFQM